jgi:hypothetical protein
MHLQPFFAGSDEYPKGPQRNTWSGVRLGLGKTTGSDGKKVWMEMGENVSSDCPLAALAALT